MNLRVTVFVVAMVTLFAGVAIFYDWSFMRAASVLALGTVFIVGAIWLYRRADPE